MLKISIFNVIISHCTVINVNFEIIKITIDVWFFGVIQYI